MTGLQGLPAVAMDATGDFVVVWASYAGGQSAGGEVYAQRYAAGGVPLGTEFLVNTYTTGNQTRPDVAMSADGDFVVVWRDGSLTEGQDGNTFGVYGQRFDAGGTPLGAEFRVNATTTNRQESPAVAMDADGDFVVVWMDGDAYSGQDGSDFGVYAQRYRADGVALGTEFRVNTYTSGWQMWPSVAMGAGGDFVVAWTTDTPNGVPMQTVEDIHLQRYTADGVAVGEEIRVNTSTLHEQEYPSVAMGGDGRYVVAWAGHGMEASNFYGPGIFAQRFAADGTPDGGEMHVSTYIPEAPLDPVVAIDAAGRAVVVWTSVGQDGSGLGIYAQRYAANGAPLGSEFRVNTTTENDQRWSAVASGGDGSIAVVWQGPSGSASELDAYLQLYHPWMVAAEPGSVAGFALTVAPSPIEGAGRVRYTLPEAGAVRVSVFDALGREVAVLADGTVAAGSHEAALDATRLAPGVYVVRLAAGGDVRTRRVTVAR